MLNALLRALLLVTLVSTVLGGCETTFAQSHRLVEMQAGADGGYQEAQMELAKAYLEGDLIPRDRISAYFWFNVAASRGGSFPEGKARANAAKTELQKLERVLTPAQVAQAEAMSREWKPKEVLGSDPMKAIFSEYFNLLLWPNDGYKSWHTNKIEMYDAKFDEWNTRIRIPGGGGCTARALGEHEGIKYESLDCGLFDSADVDRARVVFAAVAGYVWSLLPNGWYRGAAQEYETAISRFMGPLDSLCFSAYISGTSLGSDPPRAASVRLSLNKEGVTGYSVRLEFSPICSFKDITQLEHKAGLSENLSGEHGFQVSTRNSSGASDQDIRTQIDDIAKSGRFSALPRALPVVSGSSGQPRLEIENGTAFSLTVLVDGPVQRSVTVAAGTSEIVTLPVGTYRVLGRVMAPNVLPFFGTQQFSADTSYQESFYVGAR